MLSRRGKHGFPERMQIRARDKGIFASRAVSGDAEG